jgi:hypothetical protein
LTGTEFLFISIAPVRVKNDAWIGGYFMNRREFFSSAAGAGLASVGMAQSKPQTKTTPEIKSRYERMDAILKQPVLKKELFPDPVIIEKIELLRLNNSFFAVSVHGAEPKAFLSDTAECGRSGPFSSITSSPFSSGKTRANWT